MERSPDMSDMHDVVVASKFTLCPGPGRPPLLPSVFPSLLCFPLPSSPHLSFALPVLFFFALWLFLALSFSNRPVAYDTLEMLA